MMHFVRTMMAVVIALSVAMLPTAGSAFVVAKPTEMQASAEKAATAEMAGMDDCCPDHTKTCDRSSDQCHSMASCSFQFVSLADFAVSNLKYPPVQANPLPELKEQIVQLSGGSPPFRPPRV